MPVIYGPKSPRLYHLNPRRIEDRGYRTEQKHLAAAIREYESVLNVRITPHVDAPDAEIKYGEKYFQHTDLDSGDAFLVDLHIHRGDEEICPKQNLDLPLLPDDVITLGQLVC